MSDEETDALQHAGDAYLDRNLLALALARRCEWDFLRVWVDRSQDPDRPILYIELPTGQVSWHIPADTPGMDYPFRGPGVPWDGHTTEEKRLRLRRFFVMRGGSP